MFILMGINAVLPAAEKTTGIRTIVIDPGHGGKDPGAVVGKAREKDIVLDIALRLGKQIKTNIPDLKVIYTRDRDFFVPLFERAQIANRANADVFISIHANYCPSPSINGTETYVLGLHRTTDNLDVAKKENSVIVLEEDYTTRYEGFDPNLSESYIMFELIQDNYIEQSVTLAGMIQDQFHFSAKRADRDVRQAGFLVLRESAMPSVLVEAGYLSNSAENQYLMTEKGREDIAFSIYQSLHKYKNKMDNRFRNQDSEKQNVPSEKPTFKKTEPQVSKPSEVALSPSVKEKKQSDKPVGEVAIVDSKVKSDTASKPTSTQTKNGSTLFAIQIASSIVKMPLNSAEFKGIQGIREYKVKSYYKYACYISEDYGYTKEKLLEVRKKIPGAFVIAIRDGITMPATEALQNK